MEHVNFTLTPSQEQALGPGSHDWMRILAQQRCQSTGAVPDELDSSSEHFEQSFENQGFEVAQSLEVSEGAGGGSSESPRISSQSPQGTSEGLQGTLEGAQSLEAGQGTSDALQGPEEAATERSDSEQSEWEVARTSSDKENRCPNLPPSPLPFEFEFDSDDSFF